MARRRSSINSNPMVRMGRGMAKTGRSMGSVGRPAGTRRHAAPYQRDVYYHVDVDVGPPRPFWQRQWKELLVTVGIAIFLVSLSAGGLR